MTDPDPFAILADEFDPPPLPPELTSPVAFAEKYSRGRWQRAAHLELIEAACLDCIANAGRLILSVTVRAGKSMFAAEWLPAWLIGKNPDLQVLHATATVDLGRRNSRFARDRLREFGPEVFGVEVAKDSTAADRWTIAGHEGGMLALGVGGAPIGWGGDVIIVDDPYRNYAHAMSPRAREAVQEWWTGTMASRMEPDTAVIVICSRWHHDDLPGFLLREDEGWTELRIPALCDDPDNDPLERVAGESYWPERWTTKRLEQAQREASLLHGDQVWLAQYQQTPRRAAGGMFPEENWQWLDHMPSYASDWVRGWDLAATEGAGDWTASVLIGRMPDGRWVIGDARRGRWSADRVREELRDAAQQDPPGTRIELPQDPGQAGKDQAQQLVRMLAGHAVTKRVQTGSKEVRASGLSAQQRAGNLVLVEGSWNGPFVDELAQFPNGTHDDQVDAASSAFNSIVQTVDVGEAYYDTGGPLTGSR